MVDTNRNSKINRIVYYIFSIIYSLIKIYGAFFFISPASDNYFFNLGLPGWLSVELGIGSFLGGLILIAPFIPNWLKEWAFIAFGIVEISALIASLSVKGFTLVSFFPLISIGIWWVAYVNFHKWTDHIKKKSY